MNTSSNPSEKFGQSSTTGSVENRRTIEIQTVKDKIAEVEQLIVVANNIDESTLDTETVEIRTKLHNALIYLGIKFQKLDKNKPNESDLIFKIIEESKKINELKDKIDNKLKVETLFINNFFNGESIVDNLSVLIHTRSNLNIGDCEYIESILLEEQSKYIDEEGEIISQTEYDENNGDHIEELLEVVESKMDEIRDQIVNNYELNNKTLEDANLEELLTMMESKINNSKESLTKSELSSARENLVAALTNFNEKAQYINLSSEHQDHINRINQLISKIDSL
jgi:hypothetical protein